jgi:hypothetical protein
MSFTGDSMIFVDEVAAQLGDDPDMFTHEEFNLLRSCYIKGDSTTTAIQQLRDFWRKKKENLK